VRELIIFEINLTGFLASLIDSVANLQIRSEAIDPAVGVTRGVAPAGTWPLEGLYEYAVDLARESPHRPPATYLQSDRFTRPLTFLLFDHLPFDFFSSDISVNLHYLFAFLIEESGIPPTVRRGI
jgi:hypothetical protein